MKATVDTRDRFEIIGTAKTGQTGTVIVAHASEASEAEAHYDIVVDAGQYRSVWVRHRHIVETIRNGTPAGFSVKIDWRKDFEGEAECHNFLTRAAAMAFAQEGNDPAVMTRVLVYDHRNDATIWEWKA